MALRIVPQIPADGTQDAPPMPGEVELARSSFECIIGGLTETPTAKRAIRPNSAARLAHLKWRLMAAYGEAPDSMLPLIDELVRIAEGDVDPDPEAA